jgi:amino acid transporter
VSITIYNDTDMKQAGYILLQVDAAVIAGALIFLTISSFSTTKPSEEISDRTYVSIITAVVIIPFVVSAGFALVAVYAVAPDDRTHTDITRLKYIHNSFTSALIGFIYIPGFIIIITLIIYYIHQPNNPEGVIPAAVFVGAVIAGLAIAVPTAILARFDFRRFPDVKRAYEQMHEVKRASSILQCTTSDFVFNAVQEKLRNMNK